jgi:2-polyprenyl-6-methoxyphenol hydroxylase-like FAD-dependent oxidoreductase
LLAERAPWFEGSIETLEWRKIVRFERRLADRFGQGRVWLAGDSAHLTGPGGVQSMNVGIREAEMLARGIMDVKRGRVGVHALETYNEERITEWQRLLGVEPFPARPADTWLDEHLDELLPSLPFSGRALEAALRVATRTNSPAEA